MAILFVFMDEVSFSTGSALQGILFFEKEWIMKKLNGEKFKLKPGLLIRDVAGEKVVLPSGRNCVDFSRMLVLNEAAALLVEHMNQDMFLDKNELVFLLLDHYDAEYERVLPDVEELILDLKKYDMLDIK